MDQKKLNEQRADQELVESTQRDIIQKYNENTNGLKSINPNTPAASQIRDYKKKQDEDEKKKKLAQKQQEEENEPKYFDEWLDQRSEEALEYSGTNAQFEEAHKKLDTEVAKEKELAAAEKEKADRTTDSIKRQAYEEINQSNRNHYNTLEYSNYHGQNNMLPAGMTNELARALNYDKTPIQKVQDYALAYYNHTQAAMKAKQKADINAKYGYERNLIDYETNLKKIYIKDKYARKALDEEREKLKNQLYGDIASQGVEGKLTLDLLSPALTDDINEGTYTTSRIDLALNGVADLFDLMEHLLYDLINLEDQLEQYNLLM